MLLNMMLKWMIFTTIQKNIHFFQSFIKYECDVYHTLNHYNGQKITL